MMGASQERQSTAYLDERTNQAFGITRATPPPNNTDTSVLRHYPEWLRQRWAVQGGLTRGTGNPIQCCRG